MLSQTLNRASRSHLARRLIQGLPVTRRVVERFVAGEEIAEAVRATVSLQAGGRLVTLDVLGEDVIDLQGARGTTAAYLDLLAALGEAEAAAATDVSLKLSAIGQGLVDRGHDVALDHAHLICRAAADLGCTVTLDMENHSTVDSTLAIGDQLRRDFPTTGNVLQSNLRRTSGDLRELAATTARVRLVKGAYREPASVAYQHKRDVDRAYRADLDRLIASTCYPMVGTHDPAMLNHARVMAASCGRHPDSWEIQMLLGVRTDLQASAVERNERLRVYVPFGGDWYGYFMRRLAERPANVAFFLRALRHS